MALRPATAKSRSNSPIKVKVTSLSNKSLVRQALYTGWQKCSGWIMFTQHRYSETEDMYFTDVEFECEVVDADTGEVILKAENGSMKDMYNLVDKNFIYMSMAITNI